MTSTPATTSEMDDLDQLGAKAFAGFLVRKDLVRKYSRQYSRQYPVPIYVVEFLLGRYCASTDPTEIEAGLQIVKKQWPGSTTSWCAPTSACSPMASMPRCPWSTTRDTRLPDPLDRVKILNQPVPLERHRHG
jgi:hypothetical protein